MGALGPFAARPRVAVAVSGGADSMALALLADAWARARDGAVLALVVDHGLRAGAGAEAAITVERLARRGIPARLLTLVGLAHGPALAARARAARYAALAAACGEAGLTDLLLGHHRADQAETLMMRALAGSAAAGFAGMAAQREAFSVRLLRPLLPVAATRLRATLRAAGVDWIEDPSNHDPAALRARLRAGAARADGEAVLGVSAAQAGLRRREAELARADELGRRATLRPEGTVELTPGPITPEALAALLRMVAGAAWPVSPWRLARLAWHLAPATIGGVRIQAFRGGWRLLREAGAMAPAVPACQGALWDGRFRLVSATVTGAELGALAADAASFRRHSVLSAAILRTLPAIRRDGAVVAVPHIGYAAEAGTEMPRLVFSPVEPACGAPWIAGVRKTGGFGDA